MGQPTGELLIRRGPGNFDRFLRMRIFVCGLRMKLEIVARLCHLFSDGRLIHLTLNSTLGERGGLAVNSKKEGNWLSIPRKS